MCVSRNLQRIKVCSVIEEFTLEKSPTHVNFVANNLTSLQVWKFTEESILGKSLINVSSVKELSMIRRPKENIRESTLVKSPMFVNTVTKDSSQKAISDCTLWITLEKDLTSVNHVKKPSKHQANWKGMPMSIATDRCLSPVIHVVKATYLEMLLVTSWKTLFIAFLKNTSEYVTILLEFSLQESSVLKWNCQNQIVMSIWMP